MSSSVSKHRVIAEPANGAATSSSPASSLWSLTNAERDVLVISVLIKCLLFPSYRSTDFEVHRNWLAITHSLPLSKWYFDKTSQWTLDYPPFFAYFERTLAALAYVVDPLIVKLDNLEYASTSVVVFQRATVIASELVLATALLKWARTSTDHSTALVIASALLLHPALIIVDHIHFQYNGFLLGILLWSIIAAKQGQSYLCAALFAALVNFKHLFVYLAPPFAFFILKTHCFTYATSRTAQSASSPRFSVDRFVELVVLGVVVELVAFGPFVLAGGFGQIKQIVARLFPFERGLNHAYWAANFWALYSALDRVLVKYLQGRGWPIAPEALKSASRGLVTTTHFGVLPTVTPRVTFVITLALSLVFGLKLFLSLVPAHSTASKQRDENYRRFLDAITLSAMTSFLFGWHVHEKATLLFLVPLSLSCASSELHYKAWSIASTASTVSTFPLLIRSAETPIKYALVLAWSVVAFASVRRVVYKPLPTLASFLIEHAENAYLIGFFVLQAYVSFGHEILFAAAAAGPASRAAAGEAATATAPSMEFLPLLLTSVYCSVGIIWSYLRLATAFLLS